MKTARVFFNDGKVVTLPGLKVRQWVPKWTQVGSDKAPTPRFSCRFGDRGNTAFLETSSGNPAEVVTKPAHREGEEAPSFVYQASLEEVKVRNKPSFFVMTKERENDKGKVLLLIDTRGQDVEGKDGAIVGSDSHVDGLPGIGVQGKHSSYPVAMTVMAKGETITITPQGGAPILLRYEGGTRFSTAAAPIAKAIARATPEGETQRARREAEAQA